MQLSLRNRESPQSAVNQKDRDQDWKSDEDENDLCIASRSIFL